MRSKSPILFFLSDQNGFQLVCSDKFKDFWDFFTCLCQCRRVGVGWPSGTKPELKVQWELGDCNSEWKGFRQTEKGEVTECIVLTVLAL